MLKSLRFLMMAALAVVFSPLAAAAQDPQVPATEAPAAEVTQCPAPSGVTPPRAPVPSSV
jgi:hypothetical protein